MVTADFEAMNQISGVCTGIHQKTDITMLKRMVSGQYIYHGHQKEKDMQSVNCCALQAAILPIYIPQLMWLVVCKLH